MSCIMCQESNTGEMVSCMPFALTDLYTVLRWNTVINVAYVHDIRSIVCKINNGLIRFFSWDTVLLKLRNAEYIYLYSFVTEIVLEVV